MTIANDGAGAAVSDRLSSGLHGAAERLGGVGEPCAPGGRVTSTRSTSRSRSRDSSNGGRRRGTHPRRPRALLNLEDDLEVVATAADGRSAVETARAHRPDVAVVDLQMPGLDGLAVTVELARVLPSCAVVILTGRGRPPDLQQALRSGAKGFLPKGRLAGPSPM